MPLGEGDSVCSGSWKREKARCRKTRFKRPSRSSVILVLPSFGHLRHHTCSCSRNRRTGWANRNWLGATLNSLLCPRRGIPCVLILFSNKEIIRWRNSIGVEGGGGCIEWRLSFAGNKVPIWYVRGSTVRTHVAEINNSWVFLCVRVGSRFVVPCFNKVDFRII